MRRLMFEGVKRGPLASDMPGGVFTEAMQPEFTSAIPLRQIDSYEVGPRQRPDGAPEAAPELDADTIERLFAVEARAGAGWWRRVSD